MSCAQWGCLGVMVSALGCASGAPSPHVLDAQRDAGGEDGAATDGELESDGPDDSADDGSDAMDPEAGVGGDGAEGEDGDTADPPVDPVHACCDDGDCLCHGYTPTELTVEPGPYQTSELQLPLGTVSYPVDADPPFASVAVCGGFFNAGPEMAEWAPFYASHGIVTIITTTAYEDPPQTRAHKLLAALAQLAEENDSTGSPLFGRLALDRMGTSGFSMGGGGTTHASVTDATLRSSVALAPWGPATSGVTVPTLLLCGTADGVAPCSFSEDAYAGMDEGAIKMLVEIDDWVHLPDWYSPAGPGTGTSGKYALAFQKVFLEGDQRWRDVLTSSLEGASITTTLP